MNSYPAEYDDIPMECSRDFEFQRITNTKTVTSQRVCLICGDEAAGINFDVVTCISCKAFFRRNGFRPLVEFKCSVSDNCVVDQRTRRQCTSCRIRKCFAVGMSKGRIRTQEQNQYHRELVAQNRNAGLKKKEKRKKTKSNSPVNYHHNYSNLTGGIHRNHIHVLYNLFLETSKGIIPKDFIVEIDSDLTKSLNLYCVPTSCLIAFIKQLPHFHCLPVDDRLILLKNNAKIILPMLTSLFNLTFDTPIVVNKSDICDLKNKIVYSYSLISRLICNDRKLLFLIIITLLFSPCLLTNKSLNDVSCIDKKSHQLIQYGYDEHAYLLWYYILEQSFDNEEQAALTYMKIMTTVGRLQNVTSEIYDIITCFARVDRLHMMIQSILNLT